MIKLTNILESVITEETACKYTSDAIRADMIADKLKEWEDDPETIEWSLEEPEMDGLLDPYNGYDQQSYIQYINKDTFALYEGWSSLCWKGAYSKEEYKGKSKEEVIQDIKNVRFPLIAKELNLDIIDFKYWYEESWSEGVEDGYIMKIIFKRR